MTTSTTVRLRVASMVAAATWWLAGCGLAETTAVAATQAETAAQQAKEGKKMEEKVQSDIEAANQAAVDARAKAEDANE